MYLAHLRRKPSDMSHTATNVYAPQTRASDMARKCLEVRHSAPATQQIGLKASRCFTAAKFANSMRDMCR